jgi:hypothetical protein
MVLVLFREIDFFNVESLNQMIIHLRNLLIGMKKEILNWETTGIVPQRRDTKIFKELPHFINYSSFKVLVLKTLK